MTPVKSPTGRWYIAGWKIPSSLAYVGRHGEPLHPEYIRKQLMLPSAFRAIRTRTWDTEEDALEAIAEFEKLGI
jgi:hypothetical protein